MAQLSRLSGVEAGRGLAALLVVLFHAHHHVFQEYLHTFPIGEWFAFGHAGVDFFFVLSGFIIAYVHAPDLDRPARLGHYARRRFTRIYPFYWVALALTLAAVAIAPHGEFPALGHFLASALLLPTGTEPVIGVAWTLQFEVVFYLAFACLIANFRFGLTVFALWTTLLLFNLASGVALSPSLDFLTSFMNLMFLAGMLAAFACRRWRVPAPYLWLVAGLILFLALGIGEDIRFDQIASDPALAMIDSDAPVRTLPQIIHAGYALASTLMLIGLVAAERQGRLIVPRPLRALGGASFSLYLTHVLSIGAIWQVLQRTGLLHRAPPWVEFLILVGGAVLAAFVITRWIERPVTAFARMLLDARQIKTVPPGTHPGPDATASTELLARASLHV